MSEKALHQFMMYDLSSMAYSISMISRPVRTAAGRSGTLSEAVKVHLHVACISGHRGVAAGCTRQLNRAEQSKPRDVG